jgi:3-methyladenine DNA glycosylase AlkC
MAMRPADVPSEVRQALDAGVRESATLAEALAVDFAALLGVAAPGADVAAMRAAAGTGIVKRMMLGARLAAARIGATRLAVHPSDTVRGWAAFALAAEVRGVADALARIRPLADDPHFGVREWAWMAVRPILAADLTTAIAALVPWTAAASANLRRFTTEATRPRGVWCAHIAALRRDPSPGLALLEPLRADGARYVQDSVANWLNDAAKDHPAWVHGVCARWQATSEAPATARITRRALRSL